MKIYLTVPYKDKEKAKYYGAEWDAGKKKWYCEDYNSKCLDRWVPPSKMDVLVNDQLVYIKEKYAQ
jgi:hypothetical protein